MPKPNSEGSNLYSFVIIPPITMFIYLFYLISPHCRSSLSVGLCTRENVTTMSSILHAFFLFSICYVIFISIFWRLSLSKYYLYDFLGLFYLMDCIQNNHIFYSLRMAALYFGHLKALGKGKIYLTLKMLSCIFGNSHFLLRIMKFIFIFVSAFSLQACIQDLLLC